MATTYEEYIEETLTPLSYDEINTTQRVLWELCKAGILGKNTYEKACAAVGMAELFGRRLLEEEGAGI